MRKQQADDWGLLVGALLAGCMVSFLVSFSISDYSAAKHHARTNKHWHHTYATIQSIGVLEGDHAAVDVTYPGGATLFTYNYDKPPHIYQKIDTWWNDQKPYNIWFEGARDYTIDNPFRPNDDKDALIGIFGSCGAIMIAVVLGILTSGILQEFGPPAGWKRERAPSLYGMRTIPKPTEFILVHKANGTMREEKVLPR